MAKLTIPPTKSNLLRLKGDLHLAREGFEMLDQKRQILVLELIGMVESAKRAQQEVWEKMAAAYTALREALIRHGAWQLEVEMSSPRPEHTMEAQMRTLMGIHLPILSAQHPPMTPTSGLFFGSVTFDEAAAAFRAAMVSVDRLAEIENAVFRLAREVRKTQRRVNALEKIFIPSYAETLGFIGGVLDEREREEFVIMHMVKERLERGRAASSQVMG